LYQGIHPLTILLRFANISPRNKLNLEKFELNKEFVFENLLEHKFIKIQNKESKYKGILVLFCFQKTHFLLRNLIKVG